MVLSGFLFVAAEAAWHALGYLSTLAWFLEWSDIILAFLLIYLALSVKITRSNLNFGTLMFLALSLSVISYYSAIYLPVVSALGPLFYVIYSIPLLFLVILLPVVRTEKFHGRLLSLVIFVVILISLSSIMMIFYIHSPIYPTDESIFDLYSAHLFLHGINPYSPGVVSGSFAYYNYPLYANTPITTGGYVDSLTYPALSFLLFIPAILLKVKSASVMLPFFVIPLFLAWYRAWSSKKWLLSILILLPFLSLTIYASQVQFADSDIIWVAFIMLSYYVLPRNRTSGILFGLALSVKQFPAFAFPFLLVFIAREYGIKKAFIWFLFAAGTFFLINGYFIVSGPSQFIQSIMENVAKPLLGVGMGPSQLSFLGFIPALPIYYTIVMISTLFFSIFLYVVKYGELKYAIFIFPIIIFFFNYRLFIQYVFYWMILSLLPLLDLIIVRENNANISHESTIKKPNGGTSRVNKSILAILLTILLVSVAVGYHEGVQENPGHFTISSIQVKGYNSTGYIDTIGVNIDYNGPYENGTPVFFRIILPTAVDNVNMFMWVTAHNVTLYPGINESINIVPEYTVYAIPANTDFRLIAYYGSIQGTYVSNS